MNDIETNTEAPVDLREFWRPIWRRRWLILAWVVLVTSAVYLFTASKTKVYVATTNLFVQPSNAESVLGDATLTPNTERATANEAKLLQSRGVAALVKQKLQSPASPDALRARITADADPSTDFITITARGPTGRSAADLANAYAAAFVESRNAAIKERFFNKRRETGAELAATRGNSLVATRQRDRLRAEIRQLRAVQATASGGATQVDVALPSAAPIKPLPKRTARFAFVLALVSGIFAALFFERLDRRVLTAAALEDCYGLPALGMVPHVAAPAPVVDGRAEYSPQLREPMRILRLNLTLQTVDRPVTTLLVTSAIPAEGKSTVVRNLALAMYESGARVVVVEADLRRPTLARAFGLQSELGLTNVVAGDIELDETLLRVVTDSTPQETPAGELRILTAGSPAANPPAILGSARFREILVQLAEMHDVVLVDSPPLLVVGDTISLLGIAGGVLLVGRVGVTTREAVSRVRDLLARSPAADRLLGLVVDDIDASGGYGYGYGYELHAGRPNGASPAPQTGKTALPEG